MKNHRWTSEQLNYIREKYPTTPAKILAAEFGVSTSTMERTIYYHNIKKFPHNHRFIDDECKCGVRRKRVEVWAYSKDDFQTRQINPIPECNETR